MRLSAKEIKTIKSCAKAFFGVHARVLLFGSRVDDQKRGGDIDLYIIPETNKDHYFKKMNFLVALEKSLDEQKIDVVIAKMNNKRLVDKIALMEGIEL